MIRPATILPTVLAGAICTAGAVIGAEREPGDPGPGWEQSVLVERAHWPVIVRPASSAAETICSALAPADVEILHDGEPLRVTAIGPRPLRRTHALLVDTSNSMVLGYIERDTLLAEAKRAAGEYIDQLPPEDAVLVASFDESLVLGTPPTLDRAAARGAVERLRAGTYTALWDAVYYLVRYLEGVPGEKIVVLLTDGEDSLSLREHEHRKVLELTAGVPNLSIFPIGIELPQAIKRGMPRARSQLGELARRTGGRFFEIVRKESFSPYFEKVRQRLDGRLYVSYVPSPPESAAGGPVEDRSGRRGGLKIRARAGLPCKVTPLGLPGRFELHRSRVGAGAERLPSEERGLSPPVFEPLASGDGLLGRVPDLVVERGPLYDRRRFQRKGKLRPGPLREAEFAMRDVVVFTPPLPVVRETLTSAEDLLLFLLERDFAAGGADEPAAASAASFLIHGQSFLELSEILGRSLFASRPDYRAWALDRVAADVDENLGLLVEGLPRTEQPRGERIEAVRASLLERSSDPRTGRPHARLAEWLGDVPVERAALALETRLANRLLAGRACDVELSARVERVAARWPALTEWFPPALDVRILTPLVPALDAERETMGFYRFLLPWPRPPRSRGGLAPRPLVLESVRMLIGSPGAERLLRGRARIGEAGLVAIGRRELRRDGCAAQDKATTGAWRVEFDLRVGSSAEADRSVRLRAYYALSATGEAGQEVAARPACWIVDHPAADGDPAWEVVPEGRLAEALSALAGTDN